MGKQLQSFAYNPLHSSGIKYLTSSRHFEVWTEHFPVLSRKTGSTYITLIDSFTGYSHTKVFFVISWTKLFTKAHERFYNDIDKRVVLTK